MCRKVNSGAICVVRLVSGNEKQPNVSACDIQLWKQKKQKTKKNNWCFCFWKIDNVKPFWHPKSASSSQTHLSVEACGSFVLCFTVSKVSCVFRSDNWIDRDKDIFFVCTYFMIRTCIDTFGLVLSVITTYSTKGLWLYSWCCYRVLLAGIDGNKVLMSGCNLSSIISWELWTEMIACLDHNNTFY